MLSDKLQLSLVNSVNIRDPLEESTFPQDQAGFLRNGNYAWIVHDSVIQILTTENGTKIGQYDFNKHHSTKECVITHVEEIDYLPGVCLIAVAVDFTAMGPSVGMLSILYVQGTKVLGSLDFCEQITCCRYVPKDACNRSVLKNYSGALVIGTNQGKLFFIDLMIPSSAHEISLAPNNDSELFSCINVTANLDDDVIVAQHRTVVNDNKRRTFFSIQMEVLNDSGAVLSILVMPNLYTMAVGLNDGRMVFYDLQELSAFHLAYPPSDPAPLTHMSFLEPTDDPRCAVYIWTFHCSAEGAVAVMHSLMFASKIDGIYEDFQSCSVRLTMPIFEKNTFPICCQSITRALTQDDDDILTLNVLAWSSPTSKSTNIMIFDLNQWYKDEMPAVGDWKLRLKYVAVFELSNCTALHSIVNQNSVYPFNSIMRPEEHFYPNSLSFDLCMLESRKISHYRWVGVQNIVLQQFNVIGPQVVYDPNNFFDELTKVSIIPQFSEMMYNSSIEIEHKREFLLSVALEYNFVGFLRKCANAWADGSYLGKNSSSGIGLSTLTDWIWNRVRAIKDVCNTLCQPLFDYSEQRIDYGTQKQLSQCCKLLRILSELLVSILRDYRQFVPSQILEQLKTQSDSIKMASDYQEVLQWLLNVGLLPEGQFHNDEINSFPMDDQYLIVPYPYEIIRNHYNAQRVQLSDPGENFRKYLFIDAFIEKECSEEQIYEMWGDSYPPKSIQCLLRTLLIPEISLQSKHVIFVYLFMDITKVLSDTPYSSIVGNLIKFPAVFKMDPAIIKRTQAFWNLDNGKLETAVEELISPLSHDKHIPLWQRELLIRTLLKQKETSLALRALRCPGNQISPELEMITLLDNNLLSEALGVQRATGDKELLVNLFNNILHSSNFEQLLNMRLSNEEENVLRDYLKNLTNSGLPNHLNIHFVFLLQRSKFIDAANLVESFSGETRFNLEPPKQVLYAYYAAMEPTTRKITSMIQQSDVVAKELPLPMSVNLIQAKCNAKNNFFSKCVESITDASVDGAEMPFIGSPKLGIFEYRQPRIAESENSFVLDIHDGKRKTVNEVSIINFEEQRAPQNKKRRLNDAISVPKRKSYMDVHMSNLTIFKETKPSFNFSNKSPGNSSRVTPERVRAFGNFLSTPVVSKKTTPKRFHEKCPATPVSILKSRSMRGSLSPGRLSEFGDDNKSVKSITFAALPDSRDTSFNESSNLDEPTDTSTEAFYSPDKSPRNFIDGPKMRKPLSGTSSPTVKTVSPRGFSVASSLLQSLQNISQEVESFEKAAKDEVEKKIKQNEAKSTEEIIADIEAHSTTLNTTVESVESEPIEPLNRGNVLRDTSESDSDETTDEEAPDKSLYTFQRKSVLPANFGEISESESENDEEVDEEHYEDEELPSHSASGEDDSAEYGEVDLDDSEDEEPQPKKQEVICLDSSSDDDDVQVTQPSSQNNLPAFNNFNQFNSESTNGESQEIISSQEEMAAMLYDDMDNERLEDDDAMIVETVVDNLQTPQVVETMQTHEIINEERIDTTNEYSYTSATGGEMNFAIIGVTSLANETEQISQSTEPTEEQSNIFNQAVMNVEPLIESGSEIFTQAETSISQAVETNEVSNLFNVAVTEIDMSTSTTTPLETVVNQVNENEITSTNEEEKTEKEIEGVTRSLRSRSVSLEPTRESRCQSVPSNGSSSPKSRSTRASTEDREKPKRKLKTLEVIEETNTPVSSPGVLTRKRSQLNLSESQDTPQTPTRLTRRKSIILEQEAKVAPSTPSTPKRITRAVSKESLTQDDNNKTLTRQGSLRKRTTSASDNDDAKSTRSTRSTRKNSATPTSSMKSTPERQSPSTQGEQEGTSLSNRRLTRRQMQVVEKSGHLLGQISAGKLRASKSEDLTSKVEDSDNESVKSDVVSVSSRGSRKRKASKSKEDDTESNESAAKRKTAAKTLSAIQEEDEESNPKTPSRNRSRRK